MPKTAARSNNRERAAPDWTARPPFAYLQLMLWTIAPLATRRMEQVMPFLSAFRLAFFPATLILVRRLTRPLMVSLPAKVIRDFFLLILAITPVTLISLTLTKPPIPEPKALRARAVSEQIGLRPAGLARSLCG